MRRLPLLLGLTLLLALSFYLWGDRSAPEAEQAQAPAPSQEPLQPQAAEIKQVS